MEILRRHLFEILTLLVLTAGAGYIVHTAAQGRDLYRNEKSARELLMEVFSAQEARRLAGQSVPYLFLSELIESPSESGRLGGLAAELYYVRHAPPGLELYSYRGYYVTVGLQDGKGRVFFEPPADGTRPEGLGAHFRALAWPSVYGKTGGVFYYVDSRGYLFQGENAQGLFQGIGEIDLAAMDPYKDLLEGHVKGDPLPLAGQGAAAAAGEATGEGYESLPESFRRKWSFIWALREGLLSTKAPARDRGDSSRR